MALCVSVSTFALGYRLTRRSTILARKLILVFEYDGNIGWILRNVGTGPALNVIVAQKRPKEAWINPVRVPPLSKDSQMILKWLRHVNTTSLSTSYCDFEGKVYTSTYGSDLSKVFDGNRLEIWNEAEIHRHSDDPPYVE